MSDKNNHIDPAFTDQSWLEMKKLLDREMPVRPVPFFWFQKRFLWFLLLLLPIGAAYGFYFFKQQEKPASRPPREIRQQSIPSPASEPVASSEEFCDEPVLIRTGDKGPSVESNFRAEANKQEAVSVLGTVGSAKSAESSIPYLATRIPFVESGSPSLTSSSVIKVEPGTRHPASNAWGTLLEAGAFASTGFQFGGVSGGVRFHRTFGQSAWGIQTGLGYSYYSRPFPAQRLQQNVGFSDLASQAEEIFTSPSNQMDIDTTVRFYAVSTDSIVSRLHFLDIPVVATYQAGKRWQFYAGGGISLLIASQTESGTDGGSGLLRLKTSRYDATSPVTGMGEANVNPNVRVLNPFLEGGVTFFPTKRLGISAQVDAGLRDLLSNWPGDQYLNRAQVKISYWLK